MDLTFLIFLSSGLFLGWSLGANDAANVFGTAVGSRMLRFYTAAAVCAVFVIVGAVVSGAGASRNWGRSTPWVAPSQWPSPQRSPFTA
jgi:PiT family inorganic phosphate transporter